MSPIEVSKNNSKRNIFILGLALLLFVYVFIRAYLMSFTRDESYSFLEYVVPQYWILSTYNDVSANDHLLNTWLMIICNSLVGSSELSLRLPNVLAFVLFLYFSFKFTKDIENNILAVSAFVLLTVNPYLLDFFSVARGYGLTLAFTIGNLYFFYRWIITKDQFQFAILSILFASIAVLANFTLINVFLLILASIFLFILFSNDPQKFKRILIILVFPAALFSFIIPILLHLKEAGSFALQNFGGPKGIWGDTFQTLIYKIFYQQISFAYAEKIFACLGVLLFVLGIFIVLKNKEHSSELNFLRYLLFAITFLILFIYALHFISGAQFPQNRTGLFFIPFLSLLLVFVLRWWSSKSKYSILLATVIAVCSLVHFGRSANLLYAFEFKDDAYIKTAAEFIKEGSGNKPISIGVHYSFYKPFNYYSYLWKKDQWQPCYRDSLWSKEHDYYFVYQRNFAEMKIDSVKVVSHYEKTNTFLYKNNRKNRKQETIFLDAYNVKKADSDPNIPNTNANESKGNYRTDSTDQYTPALSFNLTDTINKFDNIVLRFSAEVFSKFRDANAHLVISVQRGDSVYFWQDHELNYVIRPDRWDNYSFNVVLPKSAKPGDVVKGYVWNLGIREVLVNEMTLSGRSYPF